MAIDDNTSYELTGYQVKDLASKIRGKVDSSALASVATSGLYSDLTGTPSIPTVYNGTLTIQQNGTTLGTFSANQDTNETINIAGGGGAATIFYLDDDFGLAPHIYTDSGLTTYATATDINNALDDGPVIIAAGSDRAEITSFNKTGGMANTGQWEFAVAPDAYVFSFVDNTNIVWNELPYQPKLTAGTGININAYDTISATAMTGATASTAGSAGIVPAPTTSDPDKFLKGDGTWATVPSGETTTVFYWDAPNSAMYKDSGFTTAATMSDVEAAASAGPVKIYHPGTGRYEYLVSDRIFAGGHFSTVWADNNGNLKSVAYTYPSNTWARTSVNVQKLLTASTGISIDASGNISASEMTGATSSTAGTSGAVPAPAAGDQGKALLGDGTWGDPTAKLVEMSYGESNAWAKFIAAYNAGSIVYCRASSNANPASGSQTRKAFMAYVNNAASPTSVEFQYVRSVSSKTEAQPVDQVFVYTLTNANGGTWSVASRNMAPKIAAGAGISVSYSNGTYTIRLASTDGQGGASD